MALNFEPIEGAPYRFDYPDIFRAIARGRLDGLKTYRGLCHDDLFFLLYFGLGRADVNHPWIVARIREAEADHDGTLDLWAREHYKDVSIENQTPTPEGWKRHGDLRPGDQVFAPDGRPVKVLAVTPHYTDAECWRITFDDAAVVTCGAGHLWDVEVRTRKRAFRFGDQREPKMLSTADMARHDHRPDNRIAIPVAQPLEGAFFDSPVDPYTLGVWLGDGDSSCGRITNPDVEVWANIGKKYDTSHSHVPESIARHSTVYGLSPDLRSLGIVGNKHIPSPFFRAALDQRWELLRGIMDSDGHCNPRGTCYLNLKNRQLTLDARRLAQTLGLKPTWSEYTYDHGLVYQVRFQGYREERPFTVARKLARCKPGTPPRRRRFIHAVERMPTSPTNCIQVEGGQYLCGEAMIPTHNSTILTYGLPIQELIRNPEERIGFFSHTRPAAKKFLRQIKQTLEGACLVKRWFPDVFYPMPKKQAPKWSEDDGLVIKRKSFAKEASIEAWGLVDGMPTGAHFTIRVYDDVVTKESVTTPEQIRKTMEAYELSQSLGTDQGRKRVLGTHYSFADAYAQLKSRGAYKVRIHPATHDGTRTGEPVFLSPERLAELRREQSSYVFSCQQLLNPVADEERRFKEEWLKYYGELPYGLNRYLICDPANAKKKDSDFTVMGVIGLDWDGNRFLLDLVRDKLNLTERWVALRNLFQKWHPTRVGYEQYGMQSDIQHFEECMKRERVYFSITPLGGQVGKEDRILRLVPLFEKARFWLPEKLMYQGRNLIKEFIAEELLFFPFSTHDDMLDCLARIEDPALDAVAPTRPALHPHKREYNPLEYVHRGASKPAVRSADGYFHR